MSDISCIYEPTLVLTIVHQCDVKQYFNFEGFNIHIIRLGCYTRDVSQPFVILDISMQL